MPFFIKTNKKYQTDLFNLFSFVLFSPHFRKPAYKINIEGKDCLNLCTLNFLGFIGNQRIEVRFDLFT